MQTMTPRKKMTLKLDTLKVDTLVMPAAAPIRAITTSQTCPTRCETDYNCTIGDCTQDTACDRCTWYC